MDDECVQYLAQMQKDWERQRVRMGVEALQKEVCSVSYFDIRHHLIIGTVVGTP